MDTIAKNIAIEKGKEEKGEIDGLKNIKQAHNKTIRDGKRAAKEASKANYANLRLARKAIKNNLIDMQTG